MFSAVASLSAAASLQENRRGKEARSPAHAQWQGDFRARSPRSRFWARPERTDERAGERYSGPQPCQRGQDSAATGAVVGDTSTVQYHAWILWKWVRVNAGQAKVKAEYTHNCKTRAACQQKSPPDLNCIKRFCFFFFYFEIVYIITLRFKSWSFLFIQACEIKSTTFTITLGFLMTLQCLYVGCCCWWFHSLARQSAVCSADFWRLGSTMAGCRRPLSSSSPCENKGGPRWRLPQSF